MNERDFIREALSNLAVFVREKYASRRNVCISEKREANDILTEVDLAVQEKLVERIKSAFPGDFIAAEEEGFSRFPEDPNVRAWVIDPIDGTQNFVRGYFPSFGISLALAEGGVPIAGGVIVPMTGDLFFGQRGHGSFRNDSRLEVSSISTVGLVRAEIDFGGPWDRPGTLAAFDTVMRNVGQIRCHCAAVIGICSVATGDMDAYFHVGLNPWDYAAAQVILEEAGGKVTRLDGSPAYLFDGGHGLLATNGRVHDDLIRIIHPQA
ncbi:MAG: inositol monophosphatase [Candidatus Hydrogenedentes bacterium]|nr:inositol monophosphatase [Candidatus Hydrogenedentota bacterium]